MSTDDKIKYDIRLDDYQRSILASALLTYICEGGFQNQATEADIFEAQLLLRSFGRDHSDQGLETGVINDLTPEN